MFNTDSDTNHGFDLINHAIRMGSVDNIIRENELDLFRVRLTNTPGASLTATTSFIESLTAVTPAAASTSSLAAASSLSAALHHHQQQQDAQHPTPVAAAVTAAASHDAAANTVSGPMLVPRPSPVASAADVALNGTVTMGGAYSRIVKPSSAASIGSSPISADHLNPNAFQFPWKLHDMLDRAVEEGFRYIVSWEDEGLAFRVHMPSKFVEIVMPIFFKQTKYKSFQRQLNLYGFTRINDGPCKGGYKHKYFIRGQRGLCQLITRSLLGDLAPGDPPPHHHHKDASAILDRMIWSTSIGASGPILNHSGHSLSALKARGVVCKSSVLTLVGWIGNVLYSSSCLTLSRLATPLLLAHYKINISASLVATTPSKGMDIPDASRTGSVAAVSSHSLPGTSTPPCSATCDVSHDVAVSYALSTDAASISAISLSVDDSPAVAASSLGSGKNAFLKLLPSSRINVNHNIDLSEDDKISILHKEFQFPWKLFVMLERSEADRFEHIVSWQPPSNSCFKVLDVDAFVRDVMPRFFKQTKYKSFQRQLNLYGFARIDEGHNKGAYRNAAFLKGRKDLLAKLTRVKIKGASNHGNGNNKTFRSNADHAPGRTCDSSTVIPQTTFQAELPFVSDESTDGSSPPGLNSPQATTFAETTPVASASSSLFPNTSFYSATTAQRRESGISVILEAIKASEVTSRRKDLHEESAMAESASASSPDYVENETACTSCDSAMDTSADHNGKLQKVKTGNAAMTDRDVLKASRLNLTDNLSWRQSPSESFSDWTIEVIQTDSFGKAACIIPYHVHRRVLAVGAKRSEYFAQLFKKDTSTNKSQLKLSKGEASVFPIVLDHMYTQGPLALDAVTAYSLYSLAEQLDIPSVLQAVTDFYRKSMNTENLLDFIKLGQSFRDKSLFDAAVATCAEEMKFNGFQAYANLDPEIMFHVMARNKTLPRSMKCGSDRLSQLVAICVSNATRVTLSHETFRLLTDGEMLPCIESTAAIKLLATENTLLNGKQGSPAFGDQSLHDRCVNSIVEDWDSLRGELDHNFELSNTMKSISSSILFDLLMKSKTSSRVSDGSASACESEERSTAA